MEISDLEVLDAVRFAEGIDARNYSRGCGNDSDVRLCNDMVSGNMITFIPALLGLNDVYEKTNQCT